MSHSNTITIAILAAVSFGTAAQAGTPSLSETIPAYSRDANGIAMAVTELLPSIDNCVAAHQAMGGKNKVTFNIAFAVTTSGEVGDLVIEGQEADTTGLNTCIGGTLSAMHFTPGAHAIPVQMPLTASARTVGVMQ
jgi:hypothetical protein